MLPKKKLRSLKYSHIFLQILRWSYNVMRSLDLTFLFAVILFEIRCFPWFWWSMWRMVIWKWRKFTIRIIRRLETRQNSSNCRLHKKFSKKTFHQNQLMLDQLVKVFITDRHTKLTKHGRTLLIQVRDTKCLGN